MNIVQNIFRFIPILIFFLIIMLVPSVQAQERRSSADVSLSLSPSASVIMDTTNFQYFLTFKNEGPDTALNTVVNFTLPDGLQGYVTHFVIPTTGGCDTVENKSFHCVVGTVSSGAGGRIDINVYKIEGNTRTLPANAAITSDTFDPKPENNTSTATVSFINTTLQEKNPEANIHSLRLKDQKIRKQLDLKMQEYRELIGEKRLILSRYFRQSF